MTQIVNLYGGPGTGKSTIAAHLFALLKHQGVNTEIVTEYAKDKVWEESYKVLDDQVHILGEQYHRLFRLIDKVEVIVTDSPLLLLLHYGGKMGANYQALVRDLYRGMNNHDFFLQRKKAYNPKGRMQTEDQAKEIDKIILDIVSSETIPKIIPATMAAPERILGVLIDELNL